MASRPEAVDRRARRAGAGRQADDHRDRSVPAGGGFRRHERVARHVRRRAHAQQHAVRRFAARKPCSRIVGRRATSSSTTRGSRSIRCCIVDWVEVEGPILPEADKKKRDGLIPAKDGDLAEARECLEALRHAGLASARDRCGDRSLSQAGARRTQGRRELPLRVSSGAGRHPHLEELLLPRRRLARRKAGQGQRLGTRLAALVLPLEFDARRRTLRRRPSRHADQARRAACPAHAHARRREDRPLHRRLPQAMAATAPRRPVSRRSGLYPDYDKWLEESMVLETTLYFDAVFKENLSLREFLVSDWTMLNPRLALHYGLPPLKDDGLSESEAAPGGSSRRLAHARVDPVAHLRRHAASPGASRRVGFRSDLRPNAAAAAAERRAARADAEQQAEGDDPHAARSPRHARHLCLVPPEDRPARLRVRQLRRHRPLANARTSRRAARATTRPSTPAACLPNGRAFKGPDEFKQLLAQDLDRFAEAFVEQLATYALRRVMTIDDAAQIKAIAAREQEGRLQAPHGHRESCAVGVVHATLIPQMSKRVASVARDLFGRKSGVSLK